ncbi:MarR family transcriptional regulator [Brevibacillus laterosporus]|uniref:MarR family transcriptional regulator n=1 Tax=Brevibacillus laterosporus TaxID=1465 RepID=UPI003D2105D2
MSIINFDHAERKAKKRDLEIAEQRENTQSNREKKEQILNDLKELTGDEYYIAKKKKITDGVKFAQMIMENVNFLVKIGYLTDPECAFLFKISSYLDFKTNVIVQKSKNENALISATPAYLAEEFRKTRTSISTMMNGLIKKGILAVAETGITDQVDKVCKSRTWFVNPNIVCCAPKDQIDTATKLIFRDALKNIRIKEDNKKYKLPIYLF